MGGRDEINQKDHAGIYLLLLHKKFFEKKVLREHNFMNSVLSPHSASGELCNLQIVP